MSSPPNLELSQTLSATSSTFEHTVQKTRLGHNVHYRLATRTSSHSHRRKNVFNQHMIIVSLQTAEFYLFRVDASGYVGRKTVRGKHFADHLAKSSTLFRFHFELGRRLSLAESLLRALSLFRESSGVGILDQPSRAYKKEISLFCREQA
jgi:hypothetical protein